jgi:hypothetical protein
MTAVFRAPRRSYIALWKHWMLRMPGFVRIGMQSAAKIDRAHAEFERGEGIPGDEARKRLQLMKETRSDRRR